MSLMNRWIIDYLEVHRLLLGMLTSASIIFLIVVLLITPFIISAIPDNYFDEKTYPQKTIESQGIFSYALIICVKIFKNIIGLFFVLTGIALLILPGQGLLTIFIGLLLMDYPGKYQLERKLLSYRPVLKAVNWVRVKRHKKTFDL